MKVVEIFSSIDGEGKRTGQIATFVRLAGCNLRCCYCDTKYSFDEDNQPEDGNDHSINGCQYAWLPHKKTIGNWEVIKRLIKDESDE